MTPRRERSEAEPDEKPQRRAVRRSGPSPVGVLLVGTFLVAAVLIFISTSKNKQGAEAKTPDAPVADPFEGLAEEAPPPPPSERRKPK